MTLNLQKKEIVMRKICSILVLLVLSACSAGQKAANEGTDYVWIGCHVVIKSPNKGSYAFDAAGDRSAGQYIWWKQQDKDGVLGPVTTARPCKKGE